MLSDALAGAAMGLQFNAIAATVTAVIAAALVGYPKAPPARRWWAAAVLTAGWALGDGLALAASSGAKSSNVYGAAWAFVGFAIGYLAPALIGAAVGRSVFRGTGWLTAGAVALAVTPTISALSQRVAPAVWAVAK